MIKITDSERVLRTTNTFSGRMNRLVIGARASAKNKGYSFNINRDDLIKIWEKQKGKCIYTLWDMSTITKDQKLVSIDRINSSIGYIPENIQLTCWCVNRAKSFMGEDDFFKMCLSISENIKKI